MWLKTVKKCVNPQNTCPLPIFCHQELTKRTIHSALRVFILTIMGLNKQGKGLIGLFRVIAPAGGFGPEAKTREGTLGVSACIHTRTKNIC